MIEKKPDNLPLILFPPENEFSDKKHQMVDSLP